jgi:hypothetical protein
MICGRRREASAVCGVLVVLLAASLCDAQEKQHRGLVYEGNDWKIDIRPAEVYSGQPENRAGFWIGLTNATDQASAVCLADVSYDVIDGAHGVSATVEGFSASMSPHTCNTPAGAYLILPGETLFVYGAVRVPDWATAGQEATLTMSFVSAAPGDWRNRTWAIVKGTHPLWRGPATTKVP